MTEIELYKETIKAVHKEYIEELEYLKDLLGSAIKDDIVTMKTDPDPKITTLSATLSTMDTAILALNIKKAELLFKIEREEK